MHFFLRIFMLVCMVLFVSSNFICDKSNNGIHRCYENIIESSNKTKEYNCTTLSNDNFICQSQNSFYKCHGNNNMNLCVKHYTFYYYCTLVSFGIIITIIIHTLPIWLIKILLQIVLANFIITILN